MNLIRNGSLPSAKGSPDYFTGTVRIDMPFKGQGRRRSPVASSPSNRARAAPGTHIRAGRC